MWKTLYTLFSMLIEQINNILYVYVYNIIDMNQNSLNAFYLVHKLIIESMLREMKKVLNNCEIIKKNLNALK